MSRRKRKKHHRLGENGRKLWLPALLFIFSYSLLLLCIYLDCPCPC